MVKNKDKDMEDVLAAERSRGRRQPQSVPSREERRLLRRIAAMILDKNCSLSDLFFAMSSGCKSSLSGFGIT